MDRLSKRKTYRVSVPGHLLYVINDSRSRRAKDKGRLLLPFPGLLQHLVTNPCTWYTVSFKPCRRDNGPDNLDQETAPSMYIRVVHSQCLLFIRPRLSNQHIVNQQTNPCGSLLAAGVANRTKAEPITWLSDSVRSNDACGWMRNDAHSEPSVCHVLACQLPVLQLLITVLLQAPWRHNLWTLPGSTKDPVSSQQSARGLSRLCENDSGVIVFC